MNIENIDPIEVKYGQELGVFDPKTKLIKLEVDGEAMTLAVDAVIENPKLISDFPADAAYIFGWLASHVAHQRQILIWVSIGALNVNETLLTKH